MRGVTTTCLNTPSNKDRLTLLVIEEIKQSVFSLTEDVGFKEQDFVGLTMTFLWTSFSVTLVNVDKLQAKTRTADERPLYLSW